MHATGSRDLFVLVADQDMIETMTGLLSRPEDLGIRRIEFALRKHLQRDAGCRSKAAGSLRPFIRDHRHALVMFDKHGCGRDDYSRKEIQDEVEQDLSRNGWESRAKAIVIDPELEAWVWSRSGEVPEILGWSRDYEKLRGHLRSAEHWPAHSSKPPDPKEAMKAALRGRRKQPSGALFGKLASSVSLRECRDPAFHELRETLRAWFPPESDQDA